MTKARDIDPERPAADHGFDREDGYSGQDYHRDHDVPPTGTLSPRPPGDGTLPPDAGVRASIDPAAGTVHGAGAGAGGGGAGEDFDDDAAGGAGA